MNRLRVWRRSKHVSVEELSQRTGVPSSAIKLAEEGVRLPNKEQREAIAKELGIVPASLFKNIQHQLETEKGLLKHMKGEQPNDSI